MIEDAGIADDDVERAWRLTRAAYDDPEFEGLEIDDTRAIIDSTGSSLHVAFRGTAQPQDIVTHANAIMNPWARDAANGPDEPWESVAAARGDANVHAGFRAGLDRRRRG